MDKFMDMLGNIFVAIAEGISSAIDSTPPELLGFVVIALGIYAFVKRH